MTFNIQLFASAAAHTLHFGRAWTPVKLTERAAMARHHDPVSSAPHAPLLSMLTCIR
jgi:hypothetical protein